MTTVRGVLLRAGPVPEQTKFEKEIVVPLDSGALGAGLDQDLNLTAACRIRIYGGQVRIEEKPTNAWTEDDLANLCADKRRETARLEFKRELNLETKGQRKEVAKDAIGMANGGGGLIIYGVSETKLADGSTAAGSLMPLKDGSLADRLNNVLDDSADPRLKFELHVIDAESGGIYLVVELFAGRRPHMDRHGTYFIRTNQRVRPMTDAEVSEAHRDRFAREATAYHAMEDERIGGTASDPRLQRGPTTADQILSTEAGDTEAPGWFTVRMTPRPLEHGSFDPTKIKTSVLQDLTIDDTWYLEPPLAYFELRPRPDGFHARIPNRDDVPATYTFDIWSDGLMQFGFRIRPSISSGNPAEDRQIPTRSIADYIHDYSFLFAAAHRAIGREPHVCIQAFLDNVQGHTLGLGRPHNFPDRAELVDASVESDPLELDLTDLDEAFGPWLKATMDRIYLAGGITGGVEFLDENGARTTQ